MIHIGYPAFLGVSVKDAGGQGALIASTEPGLPADKAGIVAGDVITSLTARRDLGGLAPYRDRQGRSRRHGVDHLYGRERYVPQVQATLITGPAD